MYDQFEALRQYHFDAMYANPRRWFLSVAFIDRWSRGRYLYDVLNTLGGVDMVRGKANVKKSASKGSAVWTEFVDIPLGVVTQAEIHAVYADDTVVYDHFQALLENGYRVSFVYNFQNDAATCSITCKDPASVNDGKTFTAFHMNWIEALRVALYKHYVIAQQVWGDAGGKSDAPRFG